MALMNGQTAQLIADYQGSDEDKKKAAFAQLVKAGILKSESEKK